MSSEINMCLNCGKIQDYVEYKNRYISEYSKFEFIPTNDYRECMSCGKESIIQVDEEIAPYIYSLNKLGLITKFCCAGHTTTNYDTAYIVFRRNYIDAMKKLYSEFIKNNPEYNCLIIKKFHNGTHISVDLSHEYPNIETTEELIKYNCYINKRCMKHKKSFYGFLDFIIDNIKILREVN